MVTDGVCTAPCYRDHDCSALPESLLFDSNRMVLVEIGIVSMCTAEQKSIGTINSLWQTQPPKGSTAGAKDMNMRPLRGFGLEITKSRQQLDLSLCLKEGASYAMYSEGFL